MFHGLVSTAKPKTRECGPLRGSTAGARFLHDVILVNARCRKFGKPGKIEHLGLGYLSSTLCAAGRRAEIVDAHFHDLPSEAVVERLEALPSRVAGFSLFVNNVEETRRIVRGLRAGGDRRHITLGGHHATFNSREILEAWPEVDSIVLGEGEQPLVALARCLASGEDWTRLPGLCVRGRGQVSSNPCPPLVSDLDALPFPDRRPYLEHMREEGTATILSSRGCYGACSFCSIRAFHRLSPGPAWRARRASGVADEIEELVRRHGVRHIEFADDNLIGYGPAGRERAWELGREILRRKLAITFFFICRANDLNPDLLRFLQEAGLRGVDIGVESWVPSHLRLYRKGLHVDQNRRGVALLKELKLANRFYLIPSNPYATPAELLTNLEELERVGLGHFPESAAFNRLTVFKGSPIESQLRKAGLLTTRRGRASFEGPLPYRFVHPAMAEVHRQGERLYLAQARLVERLRARLAGPNRNTCERQFADAASQAVYRAAFDLFKAVVQRAAQAERAPAVLGLAPRLARLRRQLARIHARERRGDFARFATMTFRIGRSAVRYPPNPVRRLVAEASQAMGIGAAPAGARDVVEA